LYCERALKWEPHCKACQESLKLYNQAAGIDPYTPPVFFLNSAYQYISGSLSPMNWFLLSMLCLSVAIFFWKSKWKIKVNRYFKQAMVILALFFFLASYTENERRSNIMRVVLMESSHLYLSPDTMSEKKEELIAGEVFVITDKIGDWLKVRTKGLDVGWIEEKKLQYIIL
jgi:hypothetical protein